MNFSSKHSPWVGIRNSTDYSPFGVELDGRTVSGGYRFGFQNQEKDDEIKGEGNSINYTFRMHDPRLGRFFAVDPLYNYFPLNSTYMFSENKLIQGIELEGLQVAYVYNVVGYGETKKVIKSHNESNYQDFNQRVYRYYNGQGEIYKELVQKLDSKGNVISSQFKRFPVDGNPITKNNEPSLLTSLKGEKPKPFYENTWLEEGSLEGNYDGFNTGVEFSGEQGFYTRGLPLISGTVSVITAPYSLSGSVVKYTFNSIVLLNGADDLTTARDGSTAFSREFSQTIGKQNIENIKLSINVLSTFSGGKGMVKNIITKTPQNGPETTGFIMDGISLSYSLNKKKQ
jgi:RHS repeat-associated protein